MPRKANPNMRKSAAQSQKEYIQRTKDKLTEEVYNAREAQRKRKSRKEVWKKLDKKEKERRRELQRIRAKRYRDAKREREKGHVRQSDPDGVNKDTNDLREKGLKVI